MTERTSPEITVMRRSGGNPAPVITVPIAKESRRVFRLMSDDYIELRFNLASPVEFMIGDWIDDELFGRFVITEKQSPALNESTGAYSYSLRFDAYYMAWENRLFMLTTTASGRRVRKETSWILTDTLAAHAQEIVNNLEALGYRYGDMEFTVEIDTATVTKAGQAISISYDGTGIISAMNAMAEAFGTEWQVKGNVIRFGKCENGDIMTFSLEDNMYAVSPQRNRDTYTNRVHFFGGTRNIPDTYGRTLSFTVTETMTKEGIALFRDGSRPITPDMLIRGGMEATGEFGAFAIGLSTPSRSDSRLEITRAGEFDIEVPKLDLMAAFRWVGDNLPQTLTGVYTLDYVLSGEGFTHTLWEAERTVTDSGTGTGEGGRVARVETTVPALSVTHHLTEGAYTLSLRITPAQPEDPRVTYFMVDSASLPEGSGCRFICRATSARCILTFGGNDYGVSFNPFYVSSGMEDFSFFTFMDGNSFGTTPEGFGPGSTYTLGFSDGESEGLDITRVPLSFWSGAYSDPSSLMKIGENRLRLPSSRPGGYIDSPYATDGERIVEKSVVLDHIYPRCVLKVTGVTGTRRKDSTENADGTETYWNWTQYTVTASLKDGSPFPFRKSHIKAGVTLQARFITPEDAGMAAADAPARLAGMTFDVLLGSGADGEPEYTLRRNTDYGAKLPNETLRPDVGDPFVLLGWDVEALPSFGLVAAAERELEAAAEEYMAALEDIFRCTMFPSSMRALDRLPSEGRRVRVLFAGKEKTSRILGYTMKLDMPWDFPEYEVGETEAYSRLRLLESRLAEGAASAGGTVTADADGQSGQVPDMSPYLTADEAAETYATKDDAASWTDPETETETGLTVGGVTKTLLKSSAIDYPQKVVGVMTENEYLGALDAYFPNRQ